MDISELRKRKEKLKSKIVGAIEDFETENDVTVESVTAGVYRRVDNDVERIIDIKIDI
ncbi:hypothetical protein GYY_04385 [Methanococcus maripaludis X1]|jgi:hypothetical protein|uniref:Uncharacterized protein n=2 Tax=Methanococcus maripaludis TaxID=39152 RepID=A9A7T3_METM6|nr:hypothetical protein [Methanococcus maripaludis]AEK19752.1 hypothetical protein GYY_04385 [Methanococcus maripaludis X1]